MARKQSKMLQYFAEAGKTKFFASRQFQLFFSFVGFVLTVLAFMTMNAFIQNMVRDEYEHVSQDAVTSVKRGLGDLELSVKATADILSISSGADITLVTQKILLAVPNLSKFDQVLWLYKTEAGAWQFTTLYNRDADNTNFSVYFIKPDKNILSLIKQQQILTRPDLKIMEGLSFFAKGGTDNASALKIKPFGVIQTVDVQRPQLGVLIGVGSLSSVLDENGLGLSNLISRMSVRDLSGGYDLYHLSRAFNQDDALVSASQAYEFKFADHKWEVRAAFMKEPKIYFLEAIPFFVIIFGFMATAFGTLYVHSNYNKNVEMKRMLEMLKTKNEQLDSEIAEREKMTSTYQKAERENRAIIDAVSDIIFEADMNGTIIFLNARWKKITGFDIEQSLGLEIFNMLHPQDQDRQRKDFELMIKGQKAAYRAFTRLRTSDGTFRAVEMAISMIRQDESHSLRVVGTFTDVEERRRAERALGEAEKKYRAIVENAAGGIYQITPEGMFLSANLAMARILGYTSPEDILRYIRNANESVYVDGRARQAFLRDLENRGTIYNFETQVFRKDGQKIWVSESVRCVKDESGSTLYYEGSMEDITRRKEAVMALRGAKIHSDLANRAKSEFLANMSHELRTPLNAIIGFSEIIRNEVFGPVGQAPYREYAKDIHESGKKLLNIINEILDISKIEAGERQLTESIVDIEKVTDKCLELLKNKIEVNEMNISNTLRDVPNIVAEELAIKQIIMNLLSNAIKFTPRGGRITLSSNVDTNGDIRFSITDTGIGLDEAEIAKALSPFGQIESELSRSGSGTGLGLTLVDALVKLHGGELELFSQKGIGTTVTVVFPAKRVTIKKSPAPAPHKRIGQTSSEDVT